MLTDIEITQLCKRLNLSQAAQAVIEEVRASGPSRRVGGGGKNENGFTCGEKMGLTIQWESDGLERPATFMMGLWEKHTLEFYDQPPQILLRYKGKTGRNRGHWATPDYFIIRENEIGWVEYKPESILKEKSRRSPNLYTLGEDGEWHCPPAEEYAARLGFFFRVCTSINNVLFRNLKFLRSYYLPHCPPADAETAALVASIVSAEPGISLQELRKQVGENATDCIHKMIVDEQLYVDLEHYPLAEPAQVQVYANVEVARSCLFLPQASVDDRNANWARIHIDTNEVLDWDGRAWQIINIGDKETALQLRDTTPGNDAERLRFLKNAVFQELLQQGKIRGVGKPEYMGLTPEGREIWLSADKEALARANWRLDIVKRVLRGWQSSDSFSIPGRTVRDWVAKYREAEKKYGWGFIGLIDQSKKRGGHKSKIKGKRRKVLDRFIEKEYENYKGKTKQEVYREYLNYCDAENVAKVSSKSFWNAIKKRPQYEQLKAREGARAAYHLEPIYWQLTMTTPRHGDRPWECVHLDHAKLPILIRDSETGKILGKPWLTLAKDAYSRRNLGYFLTFDPPSYRSDMMVMRDIVRRFNRLPETFIVDKGSDFESVYFETALAIFWCDKLSRPTARPRSGTVIERFFGTTKQQFVYNLRGHTKLMRNVRRVSKNMNPKRFAVWPLDRFCARLEEYLFHYTDTMEHLALGQSPREAYMLGMAQGGWRHHQHIDYNEDFITATLPTTRKGIAKVVPNKGVKIGYIYYDADEFDDPEVMNTHVQVRYDPYDVSTARAYVKGKWIVCTSKYRAILAGRSQRQIALLTAELRKRNQNYARKYITDGRIAELITSMEGEEIILQQEMKERETRRALTLIHGGRSAPSAPKDQGQDSRSGSQVSASDSMDDTRSSTQKIIMLRRASPAGQQAKVEVDELVQLYGGYYAS